MNYWAFFTTGLFTGGISCVAVQGGLLATLIATTKKEAGEDSSVNGLKITGIFLLSKLVAYSLLGFGLGSLGEVFVPGVKIFGILQIFVSLYMFGVVGAMLNLHPLFRYFLIQPPRFINKLVRDQSKSRSVFAPIVLGTATVLIPCGTTQAMMAQAIVLGSGVAGAVAMGLFVLGTVPLFVLLGVGTAKIGDLVRERFMKVAALAVLVISVGSLNGGLILSGSNVYPSLVAKNIYCGISFCPEELGEPKNNIEVMINKLGYLMNSKVIRAGEKISLRLTNTDGVGCQQAFTIPALGISKIVPVGQTETVEFVAPSKSGVLAFSCSMGMYEGTFRIVN